MIFGDRGAGLEQQPWRHAPYGGNAEWQLAHAAGPDEYGPYPQAYHQRQFDQYPGQLQPRPTSSSLLVVPVIGEGAGTILEALEP